MELPKTFDPKGMDQRWYDRWMEKKLFASKPDGREPYTIVIPPPNVTGVLHMGHALNNTIQDVLIRRARMQGKNACWVPGTDHASIATEAKVVQMLRERGIKKSELSREEFLKYAWEWKEKYGGIILHQLKKLGCSCDWDRTAFTMDDDYYRSVIRVFVDLYQKGYIYRGLRMIHWDPKAKTSLSDEEVIMKEVKSKLYFLRYKLEPTEDIRRETNDAWITIATVRPETILGDAAICVNPKDERYKNLVGKFAFVPLIKRRIPIIADEYVEMEFGTGALKITPAHDANDYQIGLKHNLPVIDTLNEDGTMSEAAQLYIGQDRFECRKNILNDLEAQGHMVKVEDYVNKIGYSERTDAVVEPRLSMQWWVRMKELAKPALGSVMKGEIKFFPDKFINLYQHWMENIKDWCISRQLWWGHRIPAFYLPDGRFVVAETLDEAHQKAIADFGLSVSDLKKEDLRQDEDVMDTWFSAWLWPFEVFYGLSKPGNEDIKYYYPTTTLVTAPEIIFFWVARMIMAGFEYMHEKPFSHVYFTGIVRDKQGRKMSKSLGNSPDLLELIDRYGADAVRFGILISSPAGNDLLFDEKLIEQGRNFNNKIWNALRLVKGWKVAASNQQRKRSEDPDISSGPATGNSFAVKWFENRLNASLTEVEKLLEDFQLSAALKVLYSLVWDDFCSWYLEMIKPDFEQPIDVKTLETTIDFFERLMKLLHPFFPFITEEVYHLLHDRGENDFMMVADYPVSKTVDGSLLTEGDKLKALITSIRDLRNRNQIKPKERLRLFARNLSGGPSSLILQKLAGLSSIETTTGDTEKTIAFLVGAEKFFLKSPHTIDTVDERSRLEKDLEYHRGFLASVMKKLSNEKFVSNAKPDVIEKERKKASDAEEKIRYIEEQLTAMSQDH
jgi:valyl-tRNA synthetase